MNPDLDKLLPYPFERLASLLKDSTPSPELGLISLAVGEPQHPVPDCVRAALLDNLDGIGSYPATRGESGLRTAIADWLCRRFSLSAVDADTQVLPVNGTREALFAFAQAVVQRSSSTGVARVAMPNPGYQIYEGAAFLAGAEPLYLDCIPDNAYLPDLTAVSAADWDAVQLLYLCSPGNPTGAVMSLDYLKQALALAERHDFVIASDECYSEIYLDETAPPPGLLQAAAALGNSDYRRCVVFHSLSKRSNVPGMRSGFVAGDADVLAGFLRYRTYHGCAMSPTVQAASIAAWQDEAHVLENRNLYRQKFAGVMPVLESKLAVVAPSASFYLWPQIPDGDDLAFARRLWEQGHVRALPGSFLGRSASGSNPGAGHLRLSLVPQPEQCIEAAHRIAALL